jgi:hypothetical protein
LFTCKLACGTFYFSEKLDGECISVSWHEKVEGVLIMKRNLPVDSYMDVALGGGRSYMEKREAIK